MEPMTLGSPGKSPGNVSPGFVPSFLLGEIALRTVESWPDQSEAASTPLTIRNTRRVSFAPSECPASTPVATYRFSTPTVKPEVKRKGPPVVSLSDSLLNQSLNVSGFGAQSPTVSQPNNVSFGTPTSSRLQTDAESEEEHWITLFGFPASMASAVITWISSCGNITVRHLPSSPRANWVHLRFSCASEARRALARHRQMLGPDIMIGVGHCTDNVVMQKWRQSNDSFSEAGGTYLFSATHPQMPSSAATTGLRPLAASPDIAVEPSLLPRRSTGVVSKAMDYIFGW